MENHRVLLINGSSRKEGNTFLALSEAARKLNECGVETDIEWIGNKAMQGCTACGSCKEKGHCVFRDEVMTRIEKKVEQCDGIIVGSPVYYAGPNGALCAFLDRLFYSHGKHLRYKPAASVAVCRRGGASATFDRLNKYFTINCMPVVSSQYWNSVHGRTIGEAVQDEEGMQTMRTLAQNMAWMLKNLCGTELPVREEPVSTNYIR
ncbi:MAG: flavodoxin family protein [Bacteroidaceae bacterium]|nr:flavodoxin family protein [Bacteroidaceae bacterium]